MQSSLRSKAPGITDTVKDIACGGADEVPFKSKNISSFIRKLKDKGIQIVGTSDRSNSLYDLDLNQGLPLSWEARDGDCVKLQVNSVIA